MPKTVWAFSWPLLLIVALAGLAVGCGNNDDADVREPGEPIRALASTTIIADWIEQVGGEHVEVDSIVPMNTDVHAFVTAPGDIRKIGDADVIFIVGEYLESGFEGEIRANASGEIVVLSEGMTLDRFPDTHTHDHDHSHDDDHGHDDDDHGHSHDDDHAHDDDDHGHSHDDDHGHDDDDHGHSHDDDHAHDDDDHGHGHDDDHAHDDDDHGHGHDDDRRHDDDDHGHGHDDGHVHGELDPHVWMNPDLAIQAVERIRDTLSEMDPENAEVFAERAEDYIQQIREMDAEIAEMLSGLPANQRYIVTFHDAYGYFAARYGLTLLGFVVENPEAQPSAARYAQLVEDIREHDVRYIFKEPQFDARVIEQLARDTGAEVRSVPSDALSDEVPDYLSLMRTIASGIAGE